MAEYNVFKLEGNCLKIDLGRYKGCADLSSLASDVAANWGSIGGTLSNQTDLVAALALKANTSALSGYLPITGGLLTGTAGNGKITFPTQSSAPSTPASGFSLYANGSNALSWIGANGFTRTFDGTANTANRIYNLQNNNGTVALLEVAQTWGGVNTFQADILPDVDAARNLGSAALNWQRVRANNVVSNSNLGFFANGTQGMQMFAATRNVVIQNGGTFTDDGVNALQVTGNIKITGSYFAPNGNAGSPTYSFTNGATHGLFLVDANTLAVANSGSRIMDFYSGSARVYGNINLGNTGVISFGNSGAGSGGYDIGISRGAAGILSIGNGSTNITGGLATTLIGLGTIAPTHSLTLSSTSTGFAHYNTADQTTNFERVRGYWSSNVYYLTSEQAGSGTIRQLNIGTANRQIGILDTANQLGFFQIGSNTSASNASVLGINGVSTASTGTYQNVSVLPTINQSGTAGYRSLWISTFEQSLGSGSKLLLDLGTNSAANGGGTHTSRFSVDNNGNTTASSVFASSNGTVNVQIGQNTDTGNGNYAGIWFNQTRTNRTITNYSFLFDGTNTVFNSQIGGWIDFRANNSNLGRIFSNGNWFLGSSPVDAGFKLDVNGTARVQGNLTGTSNITIPKGFSFQWDGNNELRNEDAPAWKTGVNSVFTFKSFSGTFVFRNAQLSTNVVTIQNNSLGLGTGNNAPNESSILEIASTTKGFLPPRMTTAQRDAIVNPAEGLVVYNTTTKKLNVFTTIWEQLTSA